MLFSKLKKREKSKQVLYLYTEKQLLKYEKFIKDNFGDYDSILHEIVSIGINLDIIIIPPTKENNYYKLITMGMGAYKMNVPNELKKYELQRAELVLYLPPTWDIKSSNEDNYWPIRCLKEIARLPIDNNTWLGYGHTVSNNKENTPYSRNTNFCSMILLQVLNNKNIEPKLKIVNKINFYQLFPLYKEELEYKINNGVDSLINLFSDEDIKPIVNIQRKNYCKK